MRRIKPITVKRTYTKSIGEYWKNLQEFVLDSRRSSCKADMLCFDMIAVGAMPGGHETVQKLNTIEKLQSREVWHDVDDTIIIYHDGDSKTLKAIKDKINSKVEWSIYIYPLYRSEACLVLFKDITEMRGHGRKYTELIKAADASISIIMAEVAIDTIHE